MCRVAAVIQTGEAKISPAELKNFLLNMEYFGRDACGIAYLIGDNVRYCKETGAPSKVIGPKFEENNAEFCAQAKAILIHTRQATHGSPKERVNNHPIFGDKYCIIHNGIVQTDMVYQADGATDTEQLLRSMEKHGITAGLNRCSGQAAVIMFNLLNMNEVYFYRSDNSSMSCAWDEANHILFIASEMAIINKSVIGRTVEEYSMVSDNLYQYILSSDTCRIISEPKLKGYGWFNRLSHKKGKKHGVYVGNNPPASPRVVYSSGQNQYPYYNNYYSNTANLQTEFRGKGSMR